jgi:hypothetical protein
VSCGQRNEYPTVVNFGFPDLSRYFLEHMPFPYQILPKISNIEHPLQMISVVAFIRFCSHLTTEALQWGDPQSKEYHQLSINSRALVRQRTIPTERPPLVGEVSANFSG